MSAPASTPKKVLVIGSTGHAGVKCVEWFAEPCPNAADFDIVVVNGVSLAETVREEWGKLRPALSQVQEWAAWLRGLRERLRKLIKTRGSIVALVAERAVTMASQDHPVAGHQSVFVSSLDWMPLPIALHKEHGDTVEVKDRAFQRYMDAVHSWSFFFEVDEDRRREELYEIGKEHDWHTIEARLLPIAVNRQGLAIAAKAFYRVHKKHGDESQPYGYWVSGTVHLLPPPTSVSVEEALRTLLEDFCGVAPRSVPPDWAGSVSVPGDEARKTAVAEATSALEEAQRKQQEALDAEATADEFKRLLYEKGPPLQEIARKTFETMDIRTEDSPVSDEFMLVWEGEKVLVEVTGAGKSVAGRDLSQLMKDLGNYLAEVGQDVKGVLVGNAWVALPPHERDTPDRPIFPDNVQKTARNRSIALVSTLELFKAYCAFLDGNVTPEQVFRRIADRSSVVTLVD